MNFSIEKCIRAYSKNNNNNLHEIFKTKGCFESKDSILKHVEKIANEGSFQTEGQALRKNLGISLKNGSQYAQNPYIEDYLETNSKFKDFLEKNDFGEYVAEIRQLILYLMETIINFHKAKSDPNNLINFLE